MEIAISRDGSCSAFISMSYERAGRNKRNYLKPVVCMGLIVDGDSPEAARTEMLTRIRPENLELSDKLMEQTV